MPGTNSERTRVRLSLAWVFAVLALVAGLALMQGTPCEREMAWTAQCETSSTHVISHVEDTPDSSSGLLDAILVAGACLAVALAVLISVALRRRRGSVPAQFPSSPVLSLPSRRLEVRLAQLCVLRT